MVKLAVGLLVAVAVSGMTGRAVAGETRRFSGTIDSAADSDAFEFCAAEGAEVALAVDGAAGGALTPFAAGLSLVDDGGKAIPGLTGSWRAPYTGLYVGRVAAEAAGSRGGYVLSVRVDGSDADAEIVDLSVAGSVDPDLVTAGGLLTYTITVANAGPGIAGYATMLDSLPAGTTFVSLSETYPRGFWECTAPPPGSPGKVSCTNKCFEPGGSAMFDITVHVASCVGDSILGNLVTVSSQDSDTSPGNDAALLNALVQDPRTCDDGSVCTIGDACAPGAIFSENFDLVAPRFVPPGWTASVPVGPPLILGWRATTAAADSPPNSVFAPDVTEIRDQVLDSPPIRIQTSTAQVIFRNRYDLELQADGGVFEIKIGNGPFLDIEQAQGHFELGGYTGTIRNEFQSPIAGRRAWTGLSDGFVTTVVDLPTTAVGQDVVLRWRLATDRTLGNVGQWIDSIVVTGPDTCRAGPLLACEDGDPCTVDTCDAVAGCGHTLISCDDGNPCTNDACDAVLQCVHANNSASCDDHDACTGTDLCVAGACVGTNLAACTAADACAFAACDASLGCVATSANLDATGYSASRVDGRDLRVIAGAWNSCPGQPRYDAAANLDRETVCIDLADFHLFMSAFGRSCPSP